MPWIARFTSDTDSPDIGTATATFDDGFGFVFVFAARVDQKNSLGDFVTRARAALDVAQAQRSQLDLIGEKIAGALNA